MKMLRSILAVCLSMVVLAASTGLNIHQHFCLGELREASVFGKAATCGMEAHEAETRGSDPVPGSQAFSAPPCCLQQLVSLKLEDNATLKAGIHFSSLIPFAILPSGTFFPGDLLFYGRKTRLLTYRYPRSGRDLPILFRTLLI